VDRDVFANHESDADKVKRMWHLRREGRGLASGGEVRRGEVGEAEQGKRTERELLLSLYIVQRIGTDSHGKHVECQANRGAERFPLERKFAQAWLACQRLRVRLDPE
jgi:hypothetical protein